MQYPSENECFATLVELTTMVGAGLPVFENKYIVECGYNAVLKFKPLDR
jgi:hypothetical protein